MEDIIRKWLATHYPLIANDWWWVKVLEWYYLRWAKEGTQGADLTIRKKTVASILAGLPPRPQSLDGLAPEDSMMAMIGGNNIVTVMNAKNLGKGFRQVVRFSDISFSEEHAYPGQSWNLHALDAMARELLMRHRLETCFAVAALPSGELICATNRKASKITGRDIMDYLETASKNAAVENSDALASIDTLSWTNLQTIQDARTKYQKVFESLSHSNTVTMVTNAQDGHAEAYLLDFVHNNRPGVSVLEIGVSMRCCAKCEALFTLYQKCPSRNVQKIQWRGGHGIMDYGGWSIPPGLTPLLKAGGVMEAALMVQKGETTRPDVMALGQPQSNPNSPAGSPTISRRGSSY